MGLDLLSRDTRALIAKYLSLREKRMLLQVSKWCYWWMKPYVQINVILFDERVCAVCGNTKRLVKRGKVLNFVECDKGHRSYCHKKCRQRFNCAKCKMTKPLKPNVPKGILGPFIPYKK